jgi:hypothetical protein
MGRFLSVGRLIPRPGIVLAFVALLFLAGVWVACAGTGACIGVRYSGSGGPYCKNGWTSAECADWESQGVNSSNWIFYAGQTCEDLGYTPTP